MMNRSTRPYNPLNKRRTIRQILILLSIIFITCGIAAIYGASQSIWVELGQIQPWAFTLGQVSFGLIAAFVAFILPPLSEFRQWWIIWRARISDTIPTLTADMIKELDIIVKTHIVQTRLGHDTCKQIRSTIKDWPARSQAARVDRFQKAGVLLRQVLEHENVWIAALKESDLSLSPHIGDTTKFRSIILAESNISDFQRLYDRMVINATVLVMITFALMVLSLSPDPFFYAVLKYNIGKDLLPDFTHERYPMLGLVFPAIWALIMMTVLGYVIGNTYAQLKMLNPERYDEALWA